MFIEQNINNRQSVSKTSEVSISKIQQINQEIDNTTQMMDQW